MNIGYPTIKQLRYLKAVIEMGSFRKAADELGVSQPTITAQISALEEALGMILLERTRRGTIPSTPGREMLPHVDRILDEIHSIRDMARYAGDTVTSMHRFGVPPTLGPYFLPEIISDLHSAYPSLRLYVREEAPRDLENKLMDGDYDLILTTLPLDVSGLTVEPLFGEPFLLAAPPDHPLAGQKAIRASQIQGERLLAIEERYRLFEQMKNLAAEFGARLLRDYEGTSLDTIRQMIGTGIGLAFLPALYVRSEIEHRSDVTVLDLNRAPTDRDVVLAWRPSSPQRQFYRDMARLIRRLCRTKLGDTLHVASD